MPFVKKYHYIIFLSLCSLIIGYSSKTFVLSDSVYKNFLITLFLLLLFLSIFLKNYRTNFLILLSCIVFIFECNATHSVPFLIHLSEAGIKIILPIAIFIFLKSKKLPETLLKIAISLTFISHGLLALNIIRTPPNFYAMTEKILCFDRVQAHIFLSVVGFLDILACIIFIFKLQKLTKYAIIYCVFWGFITALARTVFMIDLDFKTILFSGIAETLVRIPNSLTPLLLIYIKKKQ